MTALAYDFAARAAELARWNSVVLEQLLVDDEDDEDLGAALNDATDAELLAIDGIGRRTLQRVREHGRFLDWVDVHELLGGLITARLRRRFDRVGAPSVLALARPELEIPEDLTSREAEVYSALARRRGEVVSVETIVGEVPGLAEMVELGRRADARAGVASTVCKLRQRGLDIETCWRRGYVLG